MESARCDCRAAEAVATTRPIIVKEHAASGRFTLREHQSKGISSVEATPFT